MIQRDLEAAGIPYETDSGKAGFHALRHTFISNLAKGGVHPRDAQELAKQATITLTMSAYTHDAGIVAKDHRRAAGPAHSRKEKLVFALTNPAASVDYWGLA